MSLYTRTGDDGHTGLFGNARVAKGDLRIEAYGTVDELNACLGMVRAADIPADLDAQLAAVQSLLFDMGADLATPGATDAVPHLAAGIATLEGWIDASERDLEPLRTFILPGGHPEAALLHLCRTVCRRAEREIWRLAEREAGGTGAVPVEPGRYLNRLSDLLFSWARGANRRRGQGDTPWQRATGGPQ